MFQLGIDGAERGTRVEVAEADSTGIIGPGIHPQGDHRADGRVMIEAQLTCGQIADEESAARRGV